MSAPATGRRATEIARDWHPGGFRRVLTVIEYATHALGCAVTLDALAALPVTLTVERCDRGWPKLQTFRMDRAGARALGTLLFDAGCLALADPSARFEALGRVVRTPDAEWWVDFSSPEAATRLMLVAIVAGRHEPMRLTPEEATRLGLLLIHAAGEDDAAAPAEAA